MSDIVNPQFGPSDGIDPVLAAEIARGLVDAQIFANTASAVEAAMPGQVQKLVEGYGELITGGESKLIETSKFVVSHITSDLVRFESRTDRDEAGRPAKMYAQKTSDDGLYVAVLTPDSQTRDFDQPDYHVDRYHLVPGGKSTVESAVVSAATMTVLQNAQHGQLRDVRTIPLAPDSPMAEPRDLTMRDQRRLDQTLQAVAEDLRRHRGSRLFARRRS